MTPALCIFLRFCSHHALRKSAGPTLLQSSGSSPPSISHCEQNQTAAKNNLCLVWSLTSTALKLWHNKSFQQSPGCVLWNWDGFLLLSTSKKLSELSPEWCTNKSEQNKLKIWQSTGHVLPESRFLFWRQDDPNCNEVMVNGCLTSYFTGSNQGISVIQKKCWVSLVKLLQFTFSDFNLLVLMKGRRLLAQNLACN